MRGGTGEGETCHWAWGIFRPWAGTSQSHSTVSETRAREGQDEQRQALLRPRETSEAAPRWHHPPGAEATGPGKEGMQEPHSPLGQGNNGEKTHGTNPALCRQKTQTNKNTNFSAKFGGAHGAPKLPRDSSQVSVGRLEPVATSSAGSSLLPPRVPPSPRFALREFAPPPALSAAPCPQVLYKSRHSAVWLVRRAPRWAVAPLASWPSSLGNLTWTRPASAPAFPWKVPHKRLRSLFSALGEKGLC